MLRATNTYLKTLLLCAVALLGAGRLDAATGDEAIAVIEQLHAALVEAAGGAPGLTLEARIELLAPAIRASHDLTTMGRLTVGRFWRRWGDAERNSFSDAFARLSITTYASRFSGVGTDTFAVRGGSSADTDLYEVDAVIRRADADDVPMRYLLRRDDAGWRIINVFADGVSELSLMSSEYFGILEAGGFADLIAALESQIVEMRQDD